MRLAINIFRIPTQLIAFSLFINIGILKNTVLGQKVFKQLLIIIFPPFFLFRAYYGFPRVDRQREDFYFYFDMWLLT